MSKADQKSRRVDFLAVVERDQPGEAYGVTFPDVPGCFSAADESGDIHRNASIALRQHVEAMIDQGKEAPTPLSTADFHAQLVNDGFANPLRPGQERFIIQVPLYVEPSRVVRVNISLEQGLLAEIDDAADLSGLTRSAYLAAAAREKMSA